MLHHGAVEDVLRTFFPLLAFGILSDNDRCSGGQTRQLVWLERLGELGDFGGANHLVEKHLGEDRVVLGLLRTLVAVE